MDLLDDDGLTNGTITVSNSRDGTLVVACGAIAREILAINEILSWDNISIKCLPAIYHNHPEKITPAVIDVVKNNKQKYQKIKTKGKKEKYIKKPNKQKKKQK